MSADNGVYIAEFPTSDGGKEYRVTEAMAIDNCDLQYLPLGDERTKMEDAYRYSYFGNCPSYPTLQAAETEAMEIYADIVKNGWYTEYGVCNLKFNRPLVRFTKEEEQKILGF